MQLLCTQRLHNYQVHKSAVYRVCVHNKYVRDRPFNLKGGGGYGFLFRSEIFFRTTQEFEFFFGRAKGEFFFQNLTLGYMTKTLNQIIFFPPPKSEYFFRKKPNPPHPFKLNGRSLIVY